MRLHQLSSEHSLADMLAQLSAGDRVLLLDQGLTLLNDPRLNDWPLLVRAQQLQQFGLQQGQATALTDSQWLACYAQAQTVLCW